MQTHLSREEVSYETTNVSNVAEAGISLIMQEPSPSLAANAYSCLLNRVEDLFKVEQLVVKKLLPGLTDQKNDSANSKDMSTSCKL